MIKRKRILIASVVLIALTVGAVWFWPSRSYDIKMADPILSAAVPCEDVGAAVRDDGTIGVALFEGGRRKLELAISAPENKRRRVYVGALGPGSRPLKEISYSADTRDLLIDVLEDNCRGDVDISRALVALRGWPRDYLRLGLCGVSTACTERAIAVWFQFQYHRRGVSDVER